MNTGIWIDSKEAWIFTLKNGKEFFSKIISQVEDTHPGGGYGGKVPYGAQVPYPEDKILHRKQNQFRSFFSDIAERIRNSDRVLIEGPAEAKIGLSKFLNKKNIRFKDQSISMRVANRMTENQFKAEVRKHFTIL